MPLTDIAIRNAKPGTKATKLTDGAGMFLLVTPAGGTHSDPDRGAKVKRI